MNTRRKLARQRRKALLEGRRLDKQQERVQRRLDRDWRKMAAAMEGCRDWLLDSAS